MLQIGDGTVVCFRGSEGQVDACASQCQQGGAHAYQWCLEPHRNERCQSEAAIAARTQGSGAPELCEWTLICHTWHDKVAPMFFVEFSF